MGVGLKNLSSEEVIVILAKFGFVVHSQSGSHIKLRRQNEIANRETLIIPAHKQISRGTLRVIFKQASVYVSQTDLRPYFYNN